MSDEPRGTETIQGIDFVTDTRCPACNHMKSWTEDAEPRGIPFDYCIVVPLMQGLFNGAIGRAKNLFSCLCHEHQKMAMGAAMDSMAGSGLTPQQLLELLGFQPHEYELAAEPIVVQ